VSSCSPQSPLVSRERYGLERIGRARVGVGYHVHVDGTLAFVTHNHGASIVDVSNPARPNELAEIETTEASFGIFAHKGLAFVLDPGRGMLIVCIDDPEHPIVVGSCNAGWAASSVVVEGTTAYVSDREQGLRVVDVSDPTRPIVINDAYGRYRGEDITISGDTAYLACSSNGVHVIDISDPTMPRRIGRIGGGATGVAVQDAILVVTQGGGGVRVYDVSTPRSPRLLRQFFDGDEALATCFAGTYIAVADNMGGVELLSLDPSGELVEVAQYETGSATHDVYCVGEYIYLADSGHGLLVLRASQEDLAESDPPA